MSSIALPTDTTNASTNATNNTNTTVDVSEPNKDMRKIPGLSDICISVIIASFQKYPKRYMKLSDTYLSILYQKLPLDLPLSLTAPLINDSISAPTSQGLHGGDHYWKRMNDLIFPKNAYMTSNKTFFFESLIQFLMEYPLERDDKWYASVFNLAAPYISNLRITQLVPPQWGIRAEELILSSFTVQKKAPPVIWISKDDSVQISYATSATDVDVNDFYEQVPTDSTRSHPQLSRLSYLKLKSLDLHASIHEMMLGFRFDLSGLSLSDIRTLSQSLSPTTLKSLILKDNKIDKHGLAILCNFSLLEEFDISHNPIQTIPNIPTLRVLNVSNCGLTSVSLSTSLELLMKLDISLNRIGDEGFEKAVKLPNLRDLNASGCGLTNRSLEVFDLHMESISGVYKLNVSGNPDINDSSLASKISSRKNLIYFNVSYTGVTHKGLSQEAHQHRVDILVW